MTIHRLLKRRPPQAFGIAGPPRLLIQSFHSLLPPNVSFSVWPIGDLAASGAGGGPTATSSLLRKTSLGLLAPGTRRLSKASSMDDSKRSSIDFSIRRYGPQSHIQSKGQRPVKPSRAVGLDRLM